METALGIPPLSFEAGLFLSRAARGLFVLHRSRRTRSRWIRPKWRAGGVGCSRCQGPDSLCPWSSRGVEPEGSYPALLPSLLFAIFWALLKPADVEQGGERWVHLFCLTQRWIFCFLSGLTLKVWRTTWKTRWTSPSLGAGRSRTCTEAVIYPHRLATASPALAGTRTCGKGLNQAASAGVRRVGVLSQLEYFPSSLFPRYRLDVYRKDLIVLMILRWKEVLS